MVAAGRKIVDHVKVRRHVAQIQRECRLRFERFCQTLGPNRAQNGIGLTHCVLEGPQQIGRKRLAAPAVPTCSRRFSSGICEAATAPRSLAMTACRPMG